MELILYKNFSKKSNSTKQPTGSGIVADVKLKDRTTVEAPTFLINGIDLDVNYCKWNNHFYFINDIILGNNNIYELVCTQDLLATYKTEIGAYNCYIERSSSNFDVQLYDTAIQQSQQASILAHEHTTLDFYDGVGSYLLRTMGYVTSESAASESGLTTYVCSKEKLANILSVCYAPPGDSIFDEIISNANFVITGEKNMVAQSGALNNAIAQAIFDPAKYIVSCKWLPISAEHLIGQHAHFIHLGQYNTGIVGQTLGHLGASFDVDIPIPASTYNDFRDISDEWTQYTLYLGGLGAIPISGKDVYQGMKAIYTIDFITGETQIAITTAGNKLISTYNCNLSVDIALGGLSNNTLNIASSVVSAVAYGYTGHIAGAASNAIEGVLSAAQPTPSMIGSRGAISTLKSFPYVWMNKRVMGTKDIPATVYGRPCCKNLTINTLSGFVKCGGASIDLPCLAGDRDRVNSYLNNGFYYE